MEFLRHKTLLRGHIRYECIFHCVSCRPTTLVLICGKKAHFQFQHNSAPTIHIAITFGFDYVLCVCFCYIIIRDSAPKLFSVMIIYILLFYIIRSSLLRIVFVFHILLHSRISASKTEFVWTNVYWQFKL